MNLNSALKQFEAVESNLAKLDRIWKQLKELIPSGDVIIDVSDPGKYLSLKRSFEHIAKNLPKIDAFEFQICLLDPDEIVLGNVDCLELGEFDASLSFSREVLRQEEVLDEYRFRMESKRRELARQAVVSLSKEIDSRLLQLQSPSEKLPVNEPMPNHEWQKLNSLYKEIDALLGNSLPRGPRWNDMARHLGFGLRQDYEDIVNNHWPNIKQWLERSLYGEDDPLPVSVEDLGELVRAKPQGAVSTELNWSKLSPIDFERLVFNLIDRTSGYVNPQWLTHTNAPDRGRDLSVERIIQDPLTGTKNERIILSCKHTDSVNLSIIAALKEQMKLWALPRVNELIVVSSGRFTTDAIDYVEKHNQGHEAMRIEMWANSQLERLLANRPELIADFYLRK